MKQMVGERPTHRVIRERRRYRRVKIDLPMRWTAPDARASTWIECDTVNVSPTGVLFETQFVPGIRPGLPLAVLIELGDREILAVARIVDIRRSVELGNMARMAIEFTAIQTGDVKALTQRLVAEERKQKPLAAKK